MYGAVDQPCASSSVNSSSASDRRSMASNMRHSIQTRMSRERMRWVALYFCCMLLFGNYYAYDNPSALSVPLHHHLDIPYDEYAYQLNLFYAVYSLPNIFLTLLSGPLMDKYGIRRVLLLLSVCVCAGQFMFAIGVQKKSFAWMLAGRVLFGIGGESIGVAQASITTSWFKNKELAFALGFNLCVARLGSVTNSLLSPYIFDITSSVPIAIWVGFGFCLLSFSATLILVFLIGTDPPQLHHHTRSSSPLLPSSSNLMNDSTMTTEKCLGNDNSNNNDDESPTTLSNSPFSSTQEDLSEFPPNHYFRPGKENNGKQNDCKSSEHQPLLQNVISPTQDLNTIHSTKSHTKHTSHIGIRAAYSKLPLQFYLLCIICILLYGTVVPFNTIASEFLQSKWFPGDPRKAGVIMSIPDTISAFLVPILGTLIDHYGRRCTLLIACSLIIALSHAILGLTMIHPLVPLFTLGLSYSLYGTAMWPSFACVVTYTYAKRMRNTGDHEEGSIIDTNNTADKMIEQHSSSHNYNIEEEVHYHEGSDSVLREQNHNIVVDEEQYADDDDDEDDGSEHLVATAYGIATSALNVSLTIVPIIIAWIMTLGGPRSNVTSPEQFHHLIPNTSTSTILLRHSIFERSSSTLQVQPESFPIPLPGPDVLQNPFFRVEMFFVGMALMGTVFTIILYDIDRQRDSVLQLPHLSVKTVSTDVNHSVDDNEQQ